MASKKKPARDVKMPKNAKSSHKAVKKTEQTGANKQKQENLRLKEEIKTLKKNQNIESTFSYNFMPYILCFAGIFLAICFIMPEKMNFAKGKMMTPYGEISVSWKRVDGKIQVEYSVPSEIEVIK